MFEYMIAVFLIDEVSNYDYCLKLRVLERRLYHLSTVSLLRSLFGRKIRYLTRNCDCYCDCFFSENRNKSWTKIKPCRGSFVPPLRFSLHFVFVSTSFLPPLCFSLLIVLVLSALLYHRINLEHLNSKIYHAVRNNFNSVLFLCFVSCTSSHALTHCIFILCRPFLS